MADTQTFAFGCQIKEEIFLRDLISNASHYLTMMEWENPIDIRELSICIAPDKTDKTLTIFDNGIGMTQAELVDNVATFPRRASRLKELQATSVGVSMDKHFSVGFYRAYLVAEKVIVSTKNDYGDQYVSESQGDGYFTLSRDASGSGMNLDRGTKITLFLKDDQLEYLEEHRLKHLIKEHSKSVPYPIYLWTEKEISDDEDEEDKKDEEGKVEDVDEEKKKKKIKEVSHEWSLVNKQNPIWMRKPEEITKEEYAAFFKSLTNGWEENLAVKHFSVKDQSEFKAILFVPERAPFYLFDTRKKPNNVRSVFFMYNIEELIPEYLGFVKGIVDSEDLPLNISREMLQQNKILKVISENLVDKCFELFSEIAMNKEDYNKFYEAFSGNLKLGILEDPQNRAKIAELLRYHSTKSGNEMTSLNDYVATMKEGQNEIYYITGESKEAIENSPFLEKFKKKGYEVLIMADAIDKDNVGELEEFEGKKFVSVIKEFDGLCKVIKDVLGDKVEDVVISNGFVHSPCCLVTGEYGWTANMSSKIMKINPENPIVEGLRNLIDNDINDEYVKDFVPLLFENALFTSLSEERAWKLIKHN